MDKYNIIRDMLKGMGYQFNRRWVIYLPSGNYIENAKVGGWDGLTLWCKGQDGRDGRLDRQGTAFLDRIIEELKNL